MTSSKSTVRKAKATQARRTAASAPKKAAAKGKRRAAPKPVVAATTSKLEQIVGLLQRPDGASLAELCKATGWQTHSVRGALAGALKRKGHVITSEKVDDVRHYRTEVQL